jgi:hydrogenase maturation protein HypF
MPAAPSCPIRRSRGHAPLPLALPFDVAPVLAVGADLKNTCALGAGRYAWASQHIGDMDDVSTSTRSPHRQAPRELTGVRPEAAGGPTCIRTTGPASGRARTRRDGRSGGAAPPRAHRAVLAEHGIGADEQVIGMRSTAPATAPTRGVGGEVLIADYKSYRRARAPRLRALAGGDRERAPAVPDGAGPPARGGRPWDGDLPSVAACPPAERDVLAHQLETGFGCVPTSSMGRLFDAVSSLAGVGTPSSTRRRRRSSWRTRRRAPPGAGAYRFGCHAARPGVADPAGDPRGRRRRARRRAGAVVAARFHAAVRRLIADLAELCRSRPASTSSRSAAASSRTPAARRGRARLRERGFTVLRPACCRPTTAASPRTAGRRRARLTVEKGDAHVSCGSRAHPVPSPRWTAR